jgi:hypothetical protein
MTAAEWMACQDPAALLTHLRSQATRSGRKLRLFACACCRHVPDFMADDHSRQAVEASERYADGLATQAELSRALSKACGARAGRVTSRLTPRHVELVRALAARAAADGVTERSYQCALLRDVYGPPPFRRAAADAAWLTWNNGTVVRLAACIYAEQRFADMGVLADALEEAGCQDQALLQHCREEGKVHVRGCWVVDLVLGKE